MRCAWWVVAVLLAPGCSDAGRPSSVGFSVRDSAGVQLVHNEATASPAKQVEPTLMLGEQEGPEHLQFYRISDISVASDGSLFVLNMGDASVRVFDSGGVFLDRFGRAGEGPGEFQWPAHVEVFGDTVAVFDGRLIRTTFFSRNGELFGSWPAGDRATGVLYPVGRTSDGWIVQPWRNGGWGYEVGVARRDTSIVAFVTSLSTMRPDTLAVREILTYLGPRRWGVQSPTAMTVAEPLFEPEARHASDRQGNVYLHLGVAYAIYVYDSNGRYWRRATRAVEPTPVTEDLIDSYRDVMDAYWDTAQRRPEWEIGKAADEARPALPHVDALPQLGRLLVSREGNIWVERIDLDPEPLAREWTRAPRTPVSTLWDVFDPDGRFVHTVELPPRFSPHDVGADWIVGVQRDDLDIEYVIRYVVPN